MSDFSPRRALFLSLATLLLASAALATTPTARYDARIVYVPVTTHSILFGGSTGVDNGGTKLSYELNDTWDWNGTIWTQLFPVHVPTARYGHVMVWDSARNRIVMFGGRTGNATTDLNDTWIYKDGDWTQLNPPTSPSPRVLAGAVYDPLRDRIVLFGGATITSDNKTATTFHDTWEFDGTTWRQVLADGPAVDKPIMAWDNARLNILMLGVDTSIATHMYNYDPSVPAWKEKTNTRLPSCVNEGGLSAQDTNGTVFFTGGACVGVSSTEQSEEWDGNQWNPITPKLNVGRVYGPAMTFDLSRQQTLLFGGTPVLGSSPRNEMWTYKDGDWTQVVDPNLIPPARELFVFRSDPNTNAIWMFGGIDPFTTYADLWKYQFGKWQRAAATNTPPPQFCATPTSALDIDRKKLVVLCADSATMSEYDFTDWKPITGLSKTPPVRTFSSMTYDENLKKSVLFGGYITDYIDQTWLWDGTAWTEITRDLPPQRILASMWYDPHLKRTVIFGGQGRASSQDRVTRFNDMWSFDGTRWSEIKPATVPPARFGAQVAVNPTTGNVLLFGGLRVDTVQVPGTNGQPSTTKDVQVYADDFWEWDGTNWKQVTYPRVPYARENGGMAWDPSMQQMVIFGGYAAQQYLSDTWTLNGDKGWQPKIVDPIRRRAAR